jgi:protein-tyrosine-phosphatase
MAEALLRQALEARGVTDIEVLSAGTGAWEGAPASEGAYLVGLENGLDLSGHRARLVTGELVAEADLILTMARHHRARILELGGDNRVHLIGEFAGRSGATAEVADPFGADLEVYRQTRDELSALTAVVANRLAEEGRHAGG